MALSNKQWFALHGWLGVQLGFLLFIICLSGTLATLSQELDWLLDEGARNPAPPARGAAPAELAALHSAASRLYPRADVTAIHLPPESYLPAQVQVEDAVRGSLVLQLDRYSGELIAERPPLSLKIFFRIFHKQFFLIDSPYSFHGLYIVGLFGFVLLGSALSGLGFLKSWLRRLLRLHWHRGLRVFLADWHRSSGLWALAFTLLFALTGIWYWVEKVADLSGGAFATAAQAAVGEDAPLLLPPPRIAHFVDAAEQAVAGLRVNTLLLPARPGEAVHLYGQSGALLVRDAASYVGLDPSGGELLLSRDPAAMGLLERWIHTADPLHFGDFGGLWLKILWCVAGLLITLAIIVGVCLWHLRLAAGGPRKSSRTGRWLLVSNGLTLVILGAATASSLVGVTRLMPQPVGSVVNFGTHVIGPWRAEILQVFGGATKAGELRLFFPDGAANLKRATVRYLGEAGGEPLSLSARGRTLATSVGLPGVREGRAATAAGAAAWLAEWRGIRIHLEDRLGRAYTHTLDGQALQIAASGGIGLPPPVPQRAAVNTVIYLFLGGQWAMFAVWIALQWRGSR